METALIALAATLAITLCAVAAAIAQAMTASKAMDAMARQPEAAGSIRSGMVIALSLMEALTIYGLLIAFMLVSKI